MPSTVQISTIGGTALRTVLALSSAQVGTDTGVQLSRTGGQVFLQVYGHVTGGASQAYSVLYVSADGGQNWADRGEPCPQGSTGEVDATALASASDGSVSVLCTQRAGSVSFVAVSTDGGRHSSPERCWTTSRTRSARRRCPRCSSWVPSAAASPLSAASTAATSGRW